MDNFEPIEPNESRRFNQEAFEKMSKDLDEINSKTGLKKLLKAQFNEMLMLPQVQYLSLEELVDRYGEVLTEKELTEIKKIISNGKK